MAPISTVESSTGVERAVAVVPAYEPDVRLLSLVHDLAAAGLSKIVIVDDGSSPASRPLFDSLAAEPGVTVLRHEINRGKGQALKTAFRHFLEHYPNDFGVVTVDADGQHLASDAAKLAREMAGFPDSFVLGVRAFTGPVPLRSRFGNGVTRAVVSVLAGRRVRDTQCGLRAIPRGMLPSLVSTQGDRYEFEMNSLLGVLRSSAPLRQVEISTVYLDRNASSHFRPLLDSMRIYAVLARFYASSLAASLLDLGLFSAMLAAGGSLMASIVLARVVSSLFNFAVNRSIVFQSSGAAGADLAKYYGLAALVLGASYLFTMLMIAAGVPALASKIVVDGSLSMLSFAVQRVWVFVRR